MKIEFDKKKTAEALASFAKNTADFGKKVALDTKLGVSAMVEKSKAESFARRLKKYNPLFPEKYTSDDFKCPNMIMIVDDAVRRGIDVCEGAIGWLDNNNGIEVLCLYDEAVKFSGITFVPAATCDAFYYVDSFDRNRFIRTDCIFGKAHEERMAELKYIAYSLGAKRCSVEISESSVDVQVEKNDVSISEEYNDTTCKEGLDQNIVKKGSNSRTGKIEIEFEGEHDVQRPTLKWFSHDDNIKYLVEMCCDGKRAVKAERLELSGSSSATMSQKTAYCIDAAVGGLGGVKGENAMEKQATREHHSKLIYNIEF